MIAAGLTIAIPTYNRPKELRVLLEHLLPLIGDRCKLLIVDNYSDSPVGETQRQVIETWPQVEVMIVRNAANIGGGANILRCFELCKTEWLWILGDDDLPVPNALDLIFDHIVRYPKMLFCNFSSDIYCRKQELITQGLDSLVENLDNFGSILFTSASIIRRDALVKELRLAYPYCYSMAPHLVLLFMALEEDSQACFATPKLVNSQKADTTPEWAVLRQSLGIMTLLELPMSEQTRIKLARKLNAQTTSLWLLALYVMRQSMRSGPDPFLSYAFDQVCARNYCYANLITRWMEVPLYRYLIRHPKMGIRIIAGMRKILRPGSLDTNELPQRDLVSTNRL